MRPLLLAASSQVYVNTYVAIYVKNTFFSRPTTYQLTLWEIVQKPFFFQLMHEDYSLPCFQVLQFIRPWLMSSLAGIYFNFVLLFDMVFATPYKPYSEFILILYHKMP